ncbi:pre-mRNA-splicing factor 38B [Galdieria sulphuraria]|uniref:Pre-mRNA-splicing factor 38 n=1 Tax=Galdieria sulphuraria TaxID=130081 RepID=M2Y140_GALSU|nr:pre-mRNA-splicing factor 38B [Galdieria sulphuraria]EME29643.1 pre-mRNA-splicing factor 38B [Galdieria sulphuraria]|eukprot:XP_005706163.1 pre-mRNA-splicing factor 38B [Galdieria sulphuraria]
MSGRLEIYGNKKTFNFPEKVISNVLRSPYFRSLYELKTFNQVVDEIYNQVSYLEPWVAGKGVGTPSSAFCLLYKLFTLKLSGVGVSVCKVWSRPERTLVLV